LNFLVILRSPALTSRLLLLVSLLACFLTGCAKFPSTGSTTPTKRLVFTMTVAGVINPNYVYIIAMHPSTDANPTTQGPIPIISQPWGNGFVAGTAEVFIRWDPLTSPNYIIYRFRDANMLQFTQIGVPVNFRTVNPGDKILQFEVDLNQIAASVAEAPLLQSMQVNFLTMDRVPRGNDPGTKVYDALGNTLDPGHINDFVVIPLDRSGVYDNARFSNLEPTGDTPDPDLDIADWSIEVRTR
jgi:hypothetical protein